MHRIGGIEKQDGTGNVNYDPDNHELMVHLRAEKIARIAHDIPLVEVDDATATPSCSCSAGGARGASTQPAVRQARAADKKVAHAQLMHLNPFPANLGEVLAQYPKVLVPEMNLGQLSKLVRAEYLVDAQSLTQGAGTPVPRRRDRSEDPGDDRWLRTRSR